MTIYRPIVITDKIRSKFKPTRLYIKELNGTFYFGKTTSRDADSYLGSGTRWRKHIKKHGKDKVVTHWISDYYTSPDEIQEVAIAFSEENDIVHSNKWANLIPETGLDNRDPEAARQHALRRVAEGTHNFQGPESNKKRVQDKSHNFLSGNVGREKVDRMQRDLVAAGKHILQCGEIQRQQILDGKNKLVGGEVQRQTAKRLMEQGIFHSQISRTCPHCGKSCKGNGYFRYHGDRCKLKK